jgi:hypothetical protein
MPTENCKNSKANLKNLICQEVFFVKGVVSNEKNIIVSGVMKGIKNRYKKGLAVNLTPPIGISIY